MSDDEADDKADDTVDPVLVGLTGGIGSGKSTAAAMLADLGAVVIDADAVAREVVAPGGQARDAVMSRFGTTDRAELAAIVFTDDPSARADLEAIVHPAVGERVDALAAPHLAAGRVVVLEVPLLVEAGWDVRVDKVVVVDCDEEVAVERLRHRGMEEGDARRRMAAQASRADRLVRADHVVDNGGSLADLKAAVSRLWPHLAPGTR